MTTPQPHAFLIVDHGAATVSAALIGRAGGAWRLIGNLAVPAGGDIGPAIGVLVARARIADPRLAAALGILDIEPEALPRLEVRSRRPRRLAVVAGAERTLAGLAATAARSGWRPAGASAESTDPLAMSRLLLEHNVEAILVGAADPPRADERSAIRELAALVAAVAVRRPELPIVLSGSMSEGLEAFGDVGSRPGEIVLAPAALGLGGEVTDGVDPLSNLLLELALPADDPRRALGPATQALAEVLDRRIEAIVLGHDAAMRAVAAPGAGGEPSTVRLAVVPEAAVAPDDPDDAIVDGVLVWSTVPADRHRIRDRMRELRIAPWSDGAGEGAELRMAATRAALVRLAAATHVFDNAPVPDLVVVACGVWSSVPPPAVALAHIDVIRRPGASQYALDHARLLGALGAIPDRGERRLLMADLVDDLLAPLGTVVTPAGLRAGRSAGSVVVHAADGRNELDLSPGGLELVDLPPGSTAVAEFRFRDRVRLGGKGRHFAIDVAGGLGGLLVDLRDVPLRLPDRADRRRDLLAAWQASLWAGAEA
ncbi:MAG TPA: hypothetical protein VGQ89_02085 [Candidatus Limnocylindrales bacterium]|nr:hypothetical protein [Candidatus Limnocylindrales bacterium]